jgi:RNA polymerase sigma-B factor
MTTTVERNVRPQSTTRPAPPRSADFLETTMAAVEDALATLARLGTNSPRRRRIRERIIQDCLPLARREAARYRHSGESMEDLLQVATLGLIQAVDRFEPGRGVPFRHFATPTISGELKRHFRDKGWSVRVSRRVQELHQAVSRAEPALAQELRRSPTVADLAHHLSVSEADVRAGRHGAAAYRAHSLNYRVGGDDDVTELGDLLGGEDRDLEAVADIEALRASFRLLPERLRHVLALRFVENLTQVQIAKEIGVSQMHVSRLIARGLAMLRRMLLDDEPYRPGDSADGNAAVGNAATERPPTPPAAVRASAQWSAAARDGRGGRRPRVSAPAATRTGNDHHRAA